MFERILLPLDGSELAEIAIPWGETFCKKLGAEVNLLHIGTPGQETFGHMYHVYLQNTADAMRQNIKKDSNKEVEIKTDVLFDKPAEAICDYVHKKDLKMIIMTSCGASGIKALMGRVVDRVVRCADVPILLLRMKDGQPSRVKPKPISRLLLTLDGSDASKIALPYAMEVAEKFGAGITLYEMAETVYAHGFDVLGSGVAVNWDEIDAATEKYIHGYLESIEQEIKKANIPVNHVVTIGVDPAGEILEQEKKTGADLVIMATRGRGPVARWALGSVAEKVLREGSLPLFVVKEA